MDIDVLKNNKKSYSDPRKLKSVSKDNT